MQSMASPSRSCWRPKSWPVSTTLLTATFLTGEETSRIPSSFLIDADGMIVKVYQGVVNPERSRPI